MTHDLMSWYYRYNNWATEQLFERLASLSPEQFNVPGCSGHGSIHDTLAHLLSVQFSWISWLDGSITLNEALQPRLRARNMPSVAMAREIWTPIARRTDEFVDSLDEERLNRTISWSLPSGVEGGAPLWKLMLHLADHGTHTRAQIIAALRRDDVDPGKSGILSYILGGN